MKIKIILIIVSLFLVASLVIGASYAVWLLSNVQDTENFVSTECFDIDFVEKSSEINIASAIPISDEEGQVTDPYTFSLENICDLTAYYSVNVEVFDTTTLDHGLLKVSLDSDTPMAVSDGDQNLASGDSTIYELYSGYLNPGKTVTHDFRMWLDYLATLDNSQNKIVYAKILISASPGETKTDIDVCLDDYTDRGITATNEHYFTYVLMNNKVYVTDYLDAAPKDVVIPCQAGGYEIDGIAEQAMASMELNSLVLPSTFSLISTNSFYDNNLTEIIIPDGVVELAPNAFAANSLTSIDLGLGVTSIGYRAFGSNQLVDLVIPDNVITIGNEAFIQNPIVNLDLGQGVQTIGVSAFYLNEITVLNLPASLTSVANAAFYPNDGIATSVVNVYGKTSFDDFDLFGTTNYTGHPAINFIP